VKTDIRGRIGVIAAVAAVVAGATMATAPAASAATTCAPAWAAGTAYTGGATVSESGQNYRANWWTQGDDPATHAGATGSGQPWTSTGACTGGSTGGGTTTPGTGGGTTTPGTGTGTPGTASGFVFSPYKDVTANLDWNTNVMSTMVTGSRIPVAGGSTSLVATREPNLKAITLAFATGTCGSENWGGVPADAFASANISRLDSAGVNYIVSTGGAAGAFKCSSGAGLEAFIARYATPHMIGVDFDIESGQSAADVQALVSAAPPVPVPGVVVPPRRRR
jgi:chitinase